MADKAELISQLRAQIHSVQSGGSASAAVDAARLPEDDRDYEQEPKKRKAPASAYERILSLGSRRYRSRAYFRKRLLQEGFEEDEVDAALEKAQACLVIDDQRFADSLIRSRIRSGFGIRGIEDELHREGIDPSGVPGWPEDFVSVEFEDQVQRALALLEKKPIRAKNVRDAAYRRLMLKGYESSVASTASRKYAEGLLP